MDIDFERLIRLQRLDSDIRETKALLEAIPGQMSAIDQRIAADSQAVTLAKEKLAANQKRRRELELEVRDIRAQIARYKSQQSQVKSNKEYTALLREIEDSQKKIDGLEESIIQEMLAADDIEAEIKSARALQAQEEATLKKDKAALEQSRVEAEAKVAALARDREALLLEIPKEQVALYLKTFQKKGGIALSPIRDDFCALCHMRIRPQMLSELMEKNKLLICENCGRILYLQKESDKEEAPAP